MDNAAIALLLPSTNEALASRFAQVLAAESASFAQSIGKVAYGPAARFAAAPYSLRMALSMVRGEDSRK